MRCAFPVQIMAIRKVLVLIALLLGGSFWNWPTSMQFTAMAARSGFQESVEQRFGFGGGRLDDRVGPSFQPDSDSWPQESLVGSPAANRMADETSTNRNNDEEDEEERCGAMLLQGWRASQEDRILCMPDILLPALGKGDEGGTKVGLFAVFDGHGGDEASELASKFLHRLFLDHLYMSVGSSLSSSHPATSSSGLPSAGKHVDENSASSVELASLEDSKVVSGKKEFIGQDRLLVMEGDLADAVPGTFETSVYGKVLKEALSRAISDMDLIFSTEARRRGLEGGTTACVVLYANDHLLVANLGDSKALVCSFDGCLPLLHGSKKETSDSEGKDMPKQRQKRSQRKETAVGVCESGPLAKELTWDHHPDRQEERVRVEEAGGFVEDIGGVPRVNGQLAVSRSIGDVAFKKCREEEEIVIARCAGNLKTIHFLIHSLGYSHQRVIFFKNIVSAPLFTNFQNLEAEPKALALLGSNFWAAHTQQIDACVKGFLEIFGKPKSIICIKVSTVQWKEADIPPLLCCQAMQPALRREFLSSTPRQSLVSCSRGVCEQPMDMAAYDDSYQCHMPAILSTPFHFGYGVTAEPEWTGWLKLDCNDCHLIVASDGVFEKMSTRDVCRVLSAVKSGNNVSVALGSQVRDPPIPLPPRQEPQLQKPVQEQELSRAMIAVEDSRTENPLSHPNYGQLTELQGVSHDSGGDDKEEMGFAVQLLSPGPDALTKPKTCTMAPNQPFPLPSPLSRLGNLALGANIVPVKTQISASEMAKAIVDAALTSGSMDNLAALVVSLHHDGKHVADEAVKKRAIGRGMQDPLRETGSGTSFRKGRTTDVLVNLLLLPGMLVNGSESTYCYELIETVLGHKILPWHPVSDHQFTEEAPRVESLPADALHPGVAGGQLEVYREHLICTPRLALESTFKEVCLQPEGLSDFLSLIGSVPLDRQSLLSMHWDTSGQATDPKLVPPYAIHHHRYMLNNNVARGAFGEIWLALRRPCLTEERSESEYTAGFNASLKDTLSRESLDTSSMLGSRSYGRRHFNKGWAAGGHEGYEDTFILKRILVEKGSNAYLSGLRERHFGQIFLNESTAGPKTGEPMKPFHSPFIFDSEGCLRKPHDNFKIPPRLSMGNVSNPDDMWEWRPRNYSLPRERSSSDLGQEEDRTAGLAHIVRYIESFEMPGKEELWLVFRNEGKSLASLLYIPGSGGVSQDGGELRPGFNVVQPSPWWRWLKTSDAGRAEMRNIMRQLLLAVKACHDRNITHRDIKPENMVVQAEGGQSSDWPSNLIVRIIDFGSAMDRFTLKHLYGSLGPSQADQTSEYAPPEANLGKHWLHFHTDQAYVYDMWSVGVVLLELTLGTPYVFQISSRTQALLDHRLQGWDAADKETIYMLRAFMEMCILIPRVPPLHHHHHHSDTLEQSEEVRLAPWECTEEAFMQQIKQRDPLGLGMSDVWAIRLLRQLLQWYPEDRISAAEALQHPFFHPSLQG